MPKPGKISMDSSTIEVKLSPSGTVHAVSRAPSLAESRGEQSKVSTHSKGSAWAKESRQEPGKKKKKSGLLSRLFRKKKKGKEDVIETETKDDDVSASKSKGAVSTRSRSSNLKIKISPKRSWGSSLSKSISPRKKNEDKDEPTDDDVSKNENEAKDETTDDDMSKNDPAAHEPPKDEQSDREVFQEAQKMDVDHDHEESSDRHTEFPPESESPETSLPTDLPDKDVGSVEENEAEDKRTKETVSVEDKDSHQQSRPTPTSSSSFLTGLFSSTPKFDDVSGSVENAASALYTNIFGSSKAEQKASESHFDSSPKVVEDKPKAKDLESSNSERVKTNIGPAGKDTDKAMVASQPSESAFSPGKLSYLKGFFDPSSWGSSADKDLYDKVDKVLDMNKRSKSKSTETHSSSPMDSEDSKIISKVNESYESSKPKEPETSSSASARQTKKPKPNSQSSHRNDMSGQSNDLEKKKAEDSCQQPISSSVPDINPSGVFFVGQRYTTDYQLEPVLLFASEPMLAAVGWDMSFLSAAGPTQVPRPSTQNQEMPNIPALAHIDGKTFTCDSLKLANMLQAVAAAFYPDTSLFAQAITQGSKIVKKNNKAVSKDDVGHGDSVKNSRSAAVVKRADRTILGEMLPLTIPGLINTFLTQARHSNIAIPFLDWLANAVDTATDYYERMENEFKTAKPSSGSQKKISKKERLQRLDAELQKLRDANERLRQARSNKVRESLKAE